MKALLLFLFPALALAAPLKCRNLAPIEDQAFPFLLELTPSAKEFTLKVKEKGSENAAVARTGHRYFANRLAASEEARHATPSFYVSDNPENDRFAREERDTATYLFLEPAILNGKAGKLKLWLHYHGDDYQGVEENHYACREETQ